MQRGEARRGVNAHVRALRAAIRSPRTQGMVGGYRGWALRVGSEYPWRQPSVSSDKMQLRKF